ncbi:MAG TPA: hypothetical protein VFC53_09315 [Dehalococcoidia bacterium]|jgi:Flp pilus assembly pilin Flp|nr:hypothetical protein [Dehalococcoidia bacterium]
MLNLYVRIQNFIAGLHREERGQDLVEYALFGGFIALAIITFGVLAYQGMLTGMLGGMKDCVDFKASTTCAPF